MSGEAKKEKVLIIEGDGALGERIAEALRNEGYATELVRSGADGLKKIMDVMPHLVMLDVALQGADSYDILEKKQAEPMLAKIPIFLLSTQGVPINMRRVPQGSVSEFLMALHINPDEVVSKVNRYFGHATTENAPASVGMKKKIMWVEDDRLIGAILSKKFIASGFDLFHAKNGEEAIEAFKEFKPDVIILDLVLPSMSGFEILQKIKSDQNFSKVPVMILSNLSKQSDIERAKILGAQKFLVKAAVSLDQIVEEVRELCR